MYWQIIGIIIFLYILRILLNNVDVNYQMQIEIVKNEDMFYNFTQYIIKELKRNVSLAINLPTFFSIVLYPFPSARR